MYFFYTGSKIWGLKFKRGIHPSISTLDVYDTLICKIFDRAVIVPTKELSYKALLELRH